MDIYYLWGAGTYGKRTIEFFKEDIKFEGVVDKNPNKQGTNFYGLKVIAPEDVFKSREQKRIVISQNVPTSVRQTLLEKGLVENVDFYTLHDFIPRFYWEKHKKLMVKSVDIALTTMCNKKCEGCQTYLPYAKNRVHMSQSDVINDLDLLFKYVDRVMNVNICCGESLLNPTLADTCLAIHMKYGDKYQSLSVQTNATILPSDEDMRKYAEAKITLVTSNYPEQKEMTKRLIDLCDRFAVPWIFNSSGDRTQWYDLGDPRTIHTVDETLLKERYEQCWKPGMALYDGYLYICGAQLWAKLVSGVDENEYGDYFDLHKPVNEDSKKELKNILYRNPHGRGYVSHCKRCFSVMNPVSK